MGRRLPRCRQGRRRPGAIRVVRRGPARRTGTPGSLAPAVRPRPPRPAQRAAGPARDLPGRGAQALPGTTVGAVRGRHQRLAGAAAATAGPVPRLPGLGHPDLADRRAERDPPAPPDRHRPDQPPRRPARPAPAQGTQGRGRPPLRRLLRPHRPRTRLSVGAPGWSRTTPEPGGTRPRRALVPPGLPGRPGGGRPPATGDPTGDPGNPRQALGPGAAALQFLSRLALQDPIQLPTAHAPALHRVLLPCGIGPRLRKRRTLSGMATWPATADELTQLQHALGEMTPGRWQPPTTVLRIGACFVCFERVHGTGAAGDRGSPGQRLRTVA